MMNRPGVPLGIALGLGLAVAVAASAWWAGANGAGMMYVTAGNAFTVLFLWGLLALLWLLATPDRRPRSRRTLATAVVTTIVGLVAAPAAHRAGVERATERVAAASGHVIAAIERWEAEQGRPPARLLELVPDYLPVLPNTSLGMGRMYAYERLESSEPTGTRLWWDVGAAGPSARDGVLDASTGPEDRATFTALVGSAGRVESTRTYRIGRTTDNEPLDEARWRAGGEARRGMALEIAHERSFVGVTQAELVAALGAPDGEAPAPESTFLLRVGMDIGADAPGQHIYLDAASEPTWRRWFGPPPAVREWFYLPP